MKRTGLEKILRAFGLWFVGACAIACAGEEGRSLPASLDEEGGSSEGLSESCEPGEVEECSITLAEHNGVLSCYDGTRTCNSKGKWGKCGSGDIVSLPAQPEGSPATRGVEHFPTFRRPRATKASSFERRRTSGRRERCRRIQRAWSTRG
jgi:hypothetical protein